ncbi:MAG: aryl-sulfate sulfotransferase, partial [Planctomycetota bacterium]|nr:aryl-sulfate sulfotransferase [Planctomycetota bacterium]
MSVRLGVFACACLLVVPAAAQQTVGLFQSDPEVEDGYVLFDTNSPSPPHTTYLIDNGGRVVNSWDSAYGSGLISFLRDNGNLVRAGNDPAADARWALARGRGGYIQEFDWEGTLIWEYRISDTILLQHHDIVEMPNGNVLIQAWEFHTNAEAIAAGRDPVTLVGDLWTERVMELEPVPTNG